MTELGCGLIMDQAPDGLVGAMSDGFVELGCRIRPLRRDEEWDPTGCDLLLACGPMQPMTWAIIRLASMRGLPPMCFWFTEPVVSPRLPAPAVYWAARLRYLLEQTVVRRANRAAVLIQLLRRVTYRAGRLRALGEMLALYSLGSSGLISVSTDTNADHLKRFGLPVVTVPMGYHPQFGRPLGLERDIDVVFLGSTRDRRRQGIIARLEQQLAAKGIRFVVNDGTPQRGYVFGQDRTLLLNRAKIMLGIMRQPWDDPVIRLLLAAPNGAMLLSEDVWEKSVGPFQPGVHFAMAGLPCLVDAIEFYLANGAERERISAEAFAFVTRELTMAEMGREVLQALALQGRLRLEGLAELGYNGAQ